MACRPSTEPPSEVSSQFPIRHLRFAFRQALPQIGVTAWGVLAAPGAARPALVAGAAGAAGVAGAGGAAGRLLAGAGGRWRRRRGGVGVAASGVPAALGGLRCARRRRLTEHASDLALDGLQVGLLVRVDACVAGHSEKRLTGTLRVHDFLALTDDAESTLCGSLVGLSLTVGDILSDFRDLYVGFVV